MAEVQKTRTDTQCVCSRTRCVMCLSTKCLSVFSHSSDLLTVFSLHVSCTHHSLFDFTVKHALLLKLHHYGKLWEVSHTPLWNVLNILTAAVCTNVKSHSICIVILCVIIYKRCQTRLHRWKRATFTSWFKVVTRHVSCLWELVLNSQCDLVFKSPHASDILYD